MQMRVKKNLTDGKHHNGDFIASFKQFWSQNVPPESDLTMRKATIVKWVKEEKEEKGHLRLENAI